MGHIYYSHLFCPYRRDALVEYCLMKNCYGLGFECMEHLVHHITYKKNEKRKEKGLPSLYHFTIVSVNTLSAFNSFCQIFLTETRGKEDEGKVGRQF